MNNLEMYGRRVTKHVTEMRSPPRVTKVAQRVALAPGMAFDLTQIDEEDGVLWDFNAPAKRNKARRIIRDEEPLLLIRSPMCAAFSQLQRISFAKMNNNKSDNIVKHGRVHLDLAWTCTTNST